VGSRRKGERRQIHARGITEVEVIKHLAFFYYDFSNITSLMSSCKLEIGGKGAEKERGSRTSPRCISKVKIIVTIVAIIISTLDIQQTYSQSGMMDTNNGTRER